MQKWSEWKSLSCVRLFVTPWTVHGILQARILEWVAFPFSRGLSQPRNRIQVSHIAGRQILYQLSHQGSLSILGWVAFPFSRGSSWPRNRTGVSGIAGGFFTNWAMREALSMWRRGNVIRQRSFTPLCKSLLWEDYGVQVMWQKRLPHAGGNMGPKEGKDAVWSGLKVVISVLPLCVHFTWSWLLESSQSSTLPGPRLPFALSHQPWDIMNHLHQVLLTKMGLMTGRQGTEILKHRSADAGAISWQGSDFFLSHFWRQHSECLMRWKGWRNLFLISVHITDILRFSEQLGFASAW